MTGTSGVAGKVVAVIGSCLVTEYGDAALAYNLKKYLGYMAKKRSDIDIALPDEQLALF